MLSVFFCENLFFRSMATHKIPKKDAQATHMIKTNKLSNYYILYKMDCLSEGFKYILGMQLFWSLNSSILGDVQYTLSVLVTCKSLSLHEKDWMWLGQSDS